MSERCDGNTTFSAEASTEEIGYVFPDAIQLPMFNTKNEMPGVYVVAGKDINTVKMVGPCPNFMKGECTFGAPCPINALIFKE